MSKIQRYYFKDNFFQLELNLQSIRRELVYYLDNDSSAECFTCNQLICRCNDDKTSSWNSWSLADYESLELKVPPPPEKLPTPEWTIRKSVEKWISDYNTEITDQNSCSSYSVSKTEKSDKTWPPNPKSTWREDQKQANRLRKKSKESSVGSVEDFFQYFSQRMLQND